MIVQCQECSTKFRLDDSKVGDAGVKVRCAKCRHIFVVHRESPAEEPDVDTMLQGLGGVAPQAPSEPSAPPQSAGPRIEMDDEMLRTLAGTEAGEITAGPAEFSFEAPTAAPPTSVGTGEFELDISLPGEAAPQSAAAAPFEPSSFQEFSFDAPDEAGPSSPVVASGTEDADAFSFGEVPMGGESGAFPLQAAGTGEAPPSTAAETAELSTFSFESFTAAPAPAGILDEAQAPVAELSAPAPAADDFVFGEAPAKPVQDDAFSFKPAAPAEAAPAPFDAGAFSFGTPQEKPVAAAEQHDDVRPLFSKEEAGSQMPATAAPLVFGTSSLELEGPDELPPLPITSRKKGGTSSILRSLLVVVLLAAVVAGGGWWYVQQKGVAALEGVLSAVGVDMAPHFELTGVTGSYAVGADGAQLFVVNGQVKNGSRFARAELQVRATLYGAGNRPLARKTAFCGNPLPLARLVTLPATDIEKAMANRFGEGLSNLEVKGGDSIPFTIVFAAPPADAVDFAVEVAGSALAQKKE